MANAGGRRTIAGMAKYAIGFDLDTAAMTTAGLTPSDRTTIYQREIPAALRACGFTLHLQGSLYATGDDQNPLTAIIRLQQTLQKQAPRFCQFVSRVHVFRMEDWSDVTQLIAGRGARPLTDTEAPPEC